MTISWQDFEKVDMRVGVVTDAKEFPEARRPAYRLWIDFGPLGMRTSSAQLTELYSVEDLVGREIVAAVNLGTRKVAGFASEVLVLGLPSEDGHVVLISPDRDVPLGGRVY